MGRGLGVDELRSSPPLRFARVSEHSAILISESSLKADYLGGHAVRLSGKTKLISAAAISRPASQNLEVLDIK